MGQEQQEQHWWDWEPELGLTLFFAQGVPKFRFAFRAMATQIAPQISHFANKNHLQ